MKTYNEILSDVTKTATKIPQSDYLTEGKYRIFDQGKDYSGGFFNNNDGLVSDYPYIIFGDHTRVIKYVNEPCYIGADGVKLLKVINNNFDSRYIYYNILAKPIESQGYARHFKFLKEIQFTEKTLSEQRKIVAELDTIQSAIDNKKQQLALLDEVVKSRFIEMFGDIIQNTKNWELKSFTEIAKSRLGKMLDSKKQTGKEKYPYLANFNVQWFRFNLENLNEMDFSEADRIEFALKDGDLLVCEGGEVGRCAVWHNQIENCFFQKAVHRVRLNMDLVHPDYMAYWFKFRSDFNSFDDIVGLKATIAHLTGEKLKLLKIPVPPLSLQNDFASFVQQIDKSKFVVKQQLTDLQELLDSKMQEYFG